MEKAGTAKIGTPQFAEKLCSTVGNILSVIAKQRRVTEDEAVEINELIGGTPLLDDSDRIKIM